MLIGADYIKTIVNGLKTWVDKQIMAVNDKVDGLPKPNWNQNDPKAPDYIENRPGGYDVITEETVQVTVTDDNMWTFPNIWLEYWGGADHYATRIDDTPITREELQRAMMSYSSDTVEYEIREAGDGLYYLIDKERPQIDKAYDCMSFVVAKPGIYPIFGNFTESALGIYVITHQVSGRVPTVSMTYPRTVTTPQRIPSKYLDAMPGLTVNRERFEPWIFPVVRAIDDEGRPTRWIAAHLSSAMTRFIPPVTADDNGKVMKVVDGAWAAGEEADSVSLGLTGTSVGQIAVVSAVDANGVPTAWTAMDVVSGTLADTAYGTLVDQT